MTKKIIFLYVLFLHIAALCSQASSATSQTYKEVFNKYVDSFGFNIPFKQALAEHTNSFNELEINKSKVVTKQWTERQYNTVIHHYDYECLDNQTIEIVNRYIKAGGVLDTKMCQRALGDGFIIGLLIALGNNMINKQVATAQTGVALSVMPLMHILLENYRAAQVPYFDIALDKQENKYANLSLLTIGRITLAISASWLSFLGGSFMVNKVMQ